MTSSVPLSETFDRVVVINLARRAERFRRFTQLFAEWPFKTPERFEAIDGATLELPDDWKHGPGAWGCMLSHRAVLGAAIADQVSSLFVLEDDAYLASDFTARAADFLARVPDDWDCLMFGADHLALPTAVAPGIVQCVSSNRTHGFVVRGKFMTSLLHVWHHYKTEHCDIVLAALMAHFKVYAPDPFLIGQDAGYSDITNRNERARFLPKAQTQILSPREQRIERLASPRIAAASSSIAQPELPKPAVVRSVDVQSTGSSEPLFFIVGHERSGTTLMAAALDRHSAIAVPPETHVFTDARTVAKAHEINDPALMIDYLLNGARMCDLKLDREAFLGRLEGVEPTWANYCLEAMRLYAHARGKVRVGEKTPGHWRVVPQLLKLYPASRVIWLVRDGRDTVLSLMKTPWKQHDNLALHAMQWRTTTERMLGFESQFPDRILRVRFEDLVSAPESALRRTCPFIGVNFEAQQLDSAAATGVVPDWELAWKGRVFTPPDTSRIGTALRELDAQSLRLMNFLLESTLKQLGYDLGPASAPAVAPAASGAGRS